MKLQRDIVAIVLAGGFGTRLRHVVQDVPKPMAPINGRPFLEILFDYLIEQGIRRVILATGHQADVIVTHFGESYKALTIEYSHEEEALGTGGAIKQAFDLFDLEEAFVLNGDTFFPVSLARQYYFHQQSGCDATLAIKYLQHFDRYGTLNWNAKNRITGFYEKIKKEEGWINGGIYLLNKSIFSTDLPKTFSFENTILESEENQIDFFAFPSAAYFVDFGVPEDYFRFQEELKTESIVANKSLKTIFIDRDGVINRRLPGDYVRNPAQFEFLPGVIEAMKALASEFDFMFVVTNQQGIGKGLMTEVDLKSVHGYLHSELSKAGVQLTGILHAPDLAAHDALARKPNVGMALSAKEIESNIDWADCTMIGDSTSDIEFGLRFGMHTVLVGEKSDTELADEKFADLADYANALVGY